MYRVTVIVADRNALMAPACLVVQQANHRRLISLGEEPSLLDATAADPFAGPAAAAPLVLERPGGGSSNPFTNGGHGGRGGPPMPTWGGAQHMFSGTGGGVQVAPVAIGGGNSGGLPRVAAAPSGAFSASLDSLAQRLGISAPPPAVPGPMPAALRAPLPPVAEAAVSPQHTLELP